MNEDFSFNEIVRFVSSGLVQKKPNLLQYEPHVKQRVFHSSKKRGKLYAGGNRSGKTTGGIVEDLWWLTGTHPFRKDLPKPPVYGRLVTVDFENGVDKIIVPNVRQWLPKSYLINGNWQDSWNGRKKVLTLNNGSVLEVMSYVQDIDKFAGVPRHFIHMDEEPPRVIFDENKARLVDYGGSWWITMTPVDGITWTYDEIFEKGIAGDPLIEVITVDITDNPHVNKEEIDVFLSGLDEEQRKIRKTGAYIAIGGLMLKFFDSQRHIIYDADDSGGVASLTPPRTWKHYCSMDHGFANPTAWLWHAVSNDGIVITYDEHYRAEMTVKQHADFVKYKNDLLRRERGIEIFQMVADPAIKQRQATSGLSIQVEYALEGIYLALGQTRSVDAGINKMNEYLRQNRWFISSKCVNFIKEIKKYKHKPYQSAKIADRSNKNESPQKKDDHACDSARYFFSFMPDLKPLNEGGVTSGLSKEEIAKIMGPGTTFNPLDLIHVDRGLLSTNSSEYPVVVDEFVGEW